ncbi:MAG: T9SS type A sorting domain-containing protein, partial [Bacteroidota bacterium]
GNFSISPAGFGVDKDGEMIVADYGGTLYRVQDASVVPLQIVQWDLSLNGNEVHIQWESENEFEVSHYIVEQSTDGMHFSDLKSIDKKPSTDLRNYYGFMQNQLSPGKYYYRIKQVNLDGTIDLTRIKSIQIGEDQKLPFVAPNPARELATIHNLEEDEIVVHVLNSQKQLLSRQTLRISNKTAELNLETLKNGFYLLEFEMNKQHYALPLVITKY